MRGKFQYQYRYQYFEIADFNIDIDMTNILVFQYFSIYCPTSGVNSKKPSKKGAMSLTCSFLFLAP